MERWAKGVGEEEEDEFERAEEESKEDGSRRGSS